MKGSLCIAPPVSALARVFLSGQGKHGMCNGPHSVPLFLVPRSSTIPGPPWTPQAGRRYLHQRPPSQRPQLNRIPTGRPGGSGSSSGGGNSSPGPAGSVVRPPSAFKPSGGGSNYNKKNAGGSQESAKPGRLPRDREITHRFVVLRQEDGSLSEPQPTSAIMARLNPQLESLVMLAMPQAETAPAAAEEDRSEGSAAAEKRKEPPRFPICKIVDRVAERKAEYEKAREMRRKKTLSKELELNWAIDTHDLEHRMEKLREFLERGLRVEVSMMRKGKGKGRRHATQEEAAELLRRVRETVAAVPGARESKPMEGELLRVAKLVLDGPARKADK